MNKHKLFFFIVRAIVNENDFVDVLFFFFKLLICSVWLSVSSISFSISIWFVIFRD